LPVVPVHLTDETQAVIELKGTGKFQVVEAHWQKVEQGQKQYVRVGNSSGKVKKLSKVHSSEAAVRSRSGVCPLP